MPHGSSGHLTCLVYRVYYRFPRDLWSAEAGVCGDGAQHRRHVSPHLVAQLANLADHDDDAQLPPRSVVIQGVESPLRCGNFGEFQVVSICSSKIQVQTRQG